MVAGGSSLIDSPRGIKSGSLGLAQTVPVPLKRASKPRSEPACPQPYRLVGHADASAAEESSPAQNASVRV